MNERRCAVEDCTAPYHCQGYCRIHYVRWKKYGDPHWITPRNTYMRPSASTRFWRHVDISGGPDACWPWTASTSHRGYGQFHFEGKNIGSHCFAYWELVGPIPEGTELDHVKARGCIGPSCCNPAHMEPVTHRENILRGDAPSAHSARQTHCIHGHPFDDANTYWWRGSRLCRTCRERRNRERGFPNSPVSHCKHGHPLDEHNTYISPRGLRACRECRRLRKEAKRRQEGRAVRGRRHGWLSDVT
jgi:hypothetical protein